MADFLTMRHEVKDFDVWKKAYDADAPNRLASGLTDLLLVRHADNPNIVGLAFAAADLGKARAMTQSPELRDTMQNAGVTSQPEVHFWTK